MTMGSYETMFINWCKMETGTLKSIAAKVAEELARREGHPMEENNSHPEDANQFEPLAALKYCRIQCVISASGKQLFVRGDDLHNVIWNVRPKNGAISSSSEFDKFLVAFPVRTIKYGHTWVDVTHHFCSEIRTLKFPKHHNTFAKCVRRAADSVKATDKPHHGDVGVVVWDFDS